MKAIAHFAMSSTARRTLILPVETIARELDGKVLQLGKKIFRRLVVG